MKRKTATGLILGMTGASTILALVAYQSLPETMVTHWGLYGNPDGYMNKFWGVAMFPLINLAMLLLYWWVPMAEPKKENLKLFRGEYDKLMLWIFGFLNYVFVLSLLFNLGFDLNIGKLIMPAMGLMFVGIGDILPKLKQNFMVGIKTPWTLSSETVWKKTHLWGGRLFVGAGVMTIFSVLLPVNWGFLVPIGSILLASFMMMIYSFGIYRFEEKK